MKKKSMVKVLLALSLVSFVGAALVDDRTKSESGARPEVQELSRGGEMPAGIPVKAAPAIAPEQARQVTEALESGPSYEELLKEYSKLGRELIDERIQEIDLEIEERQLLERANAEQLPVRELQELGTLLRKRNALFTARIEQRGRAKRKA